MDSAAIEGEEILAMDYGEYLKKLGGGDGQQSEDKERAQIDRFINEIKSHQLKRIAYFKSLTTTSTAKSLLSAIN